MRAKLAKWGFWLALVLVLVSLPVTPIRTNPFPYVVLLLLMVPYPVMQFRSGLRTARTGEA